MEYRHFHPKPKLSSRHPPLHCGTTQTKLALHQDGDCACATARSTTARVYPLRCQRADRERKGGHSEPECVGNLLDSVSQQQTRLENSLHFVECSTKTYIVHACYISLAVGLDRGEWVPLSFNGKCNALCERGEERTDESGSVRRQRNRNKEPLAPSTTAQTQCIASTSAKKGAKDVHSEYQVSFLILSKTVPHNRKQTRRVSSHRA